MREGRSNDENSPQSHDCRAKFSPNMMAYTPDYRAPTTAKHWECRHNSIPSTIQTGYREGVGLDARLTQKYISGGELIHQHRNLDGEVSVCNQQ